MENFFGQWKHTKVENIKEYLAAIGLTEELVSVAELVKPTITIYKEADNIVIKTETSINIGEVWFKLGEEYFEFTKDGRQCKNIVTLEDSKLVQVQTWDDKETKIVREISGENMIITMTFGDIVATCTYVKVQNA